MKVIIYRTAQGREPFTSWIKSLKDKSSALRIWDRINRISEFGNLGDYKHLIDGIYEMRFHFGAEATRIYFCYVDDEIIILLGGGDKSSQTRDIKVSLQIYGELKNEK